MGVSPDIDHLSEPDLRALVVELLRTAAELQQTVALQGEEIARLKDLNQRPKIKPNRSSGMEEGTSPKRGGKGWGGRLGRGPKRTPRVAVEDEVLSLTVASRDIRIRSFRTW